MLFQTCKKIGDFSFSKRYFLVFHMTTESNRFKMKMCMEVESRGWLFELFSFIFG